MNYKTTLLAITAIVLIGAADPGTALSGRLKTIYSSQWGDTLTYHYGTDGRVSKVTSNLGYSSVYEYKGNTITERTKGGGIVTMYLNAQGYVDSLVDIDSSRISTTYADPGTGPRLITKGGVRRVFAYSGDYLLSSGDAGINPQSPIGISKKFIYDRDGYLIQERSYLGGKLQMTTDRVIDHGNIASYVVRYHFVDTVTAIDPVTLTEEIKIIKNDDVRRRMVYASGKTNTLSPFHLFGKASSGLTLQQTESYLPTSSDSTVNTYKYTYDAKQRPSTLILGVHSTDPPGYNSDLQRADTCRFTYY